MHDRVQADDAVEEIIIGKVEATLRQRQIWREMAAVGIGNEERHQGEKQVAQQADGTRQRSAPAVGLAEPTCQEGLSSVLEFCRISHGFGGFAGRPVWPWRSCREGYSYQPQYPIERRANAQGRPPAMSQHDSGGDSRPLAVLNWAMRKLYLRRSAADNTPAAQCDHTRHRRKDSMTDNSESGGIATVKRRRNQDLQRHLGASDRLGSDPQRRRGDRGRYHQGGRPDCRGSLADLSRRRSHRFPPRDHPSRLRQLPQPPGIRRVPRPARQREFRPLDARLPRPEGQALPRRL